MPYSRRKVAVPCEKDKRPGRTPVRRCAVDVIQHDKVGHILHVTARQSELGFYNIVSHSADAGNLILQDGLDKIGKEKQPFHFVVLPDLLGPRLDIRLRGVISFEGEIPMLVVHKGDGSPVLK